MECSRLPYSTRWEDGDKSQRLGQELCHASAFKGGGGRGGKGEGGFKVQGLAFRV